MSICFLGNSHAVTHLRDAALKKKLPVVYTPENADVIFVSEDTPTDPEGNRDLSIIRNMVMEAANYDKQIVLTSQVPPGFTRSLGISNIYHQAETLRIKDAELRADNPDYIAVGGPMGVSRQYAEYLIAFHCPVLRMSWEEAEMSKIAVNMMLAVQVDFTNRMAAVCKKVDAKWETVAKALHYDKRIGKEAYLTPGRWQDSTHLYRDYVTLLELEATSTS